MWEDEREERLQEIKQELAKILILDRQIGCIENEFCNGGEGCFNVVTRN